MKKLLLCVSFLAVLSQISCNGQPKTAEKQAKEEAKKDESLSNIKLAPGFKIHVYAANVDNARSMTLGARGTVFVGSRKGDKVHALVDADKDGVAEKIYVIAEGLEMPNGVAFRNGSLYVAEVSKIWRFDNIEDNLSTPPRPVLVTDKFPADKHHGWKYIAFGPDGKLYVPVGAPCDNCDDAEQDPRYASIMRMDPDGSGLEVYASGIRNTVGFAWHPQTNELWFTDNGRDMMGDDLPADELNHAPKKGMHFGYPYCHQGDLPDPKYGDKRPCSDFVKPDAKLGPHVAALGMKFYTGDMFPAEYKNQVFIAEHGSWNRSVPIGYRITMVKFNEGPTPVYKTFAEGWLKDNNKPSGRPVDVLQLPDGSLLISDDYGDAVYRVTYGG